MVVGWFVGEVCGVQGEQERGQDCSLWGPHTADNCVLHILLSPHILWPVGKVVEDLGHDMLVHPLWAPACPQKCRLYGVKSTGEIIEHDPHSCSRLFQLRQWSVQEEDDDVVHSNANLIGKLEWVHKRTHQQAEMDEDQPLQGFHQVWSQSNWSVATEVPWVRDLWYWYYAGGFPQQWYFSQLQTHVEDLLHNPAQLVCTGLEEPGADPIWSRSRSRKPSRLALACPGCS